MARRLGTPVTRAAPIETLLERLHHAGKEVTVGDRPGPLPGSLSAGRGSEEPRADGRVGSEAAQGRARPMDPPPFTAVIVWYTGEVIRCGDGSSIDEGRLGERPLPVAK